MCNALEEDVTTGVDNSRDIDRASEEDTEDDKGEDPLKSEHFDRNLLNGQRKGKKTESISNQIVLCKKDVNVADDKDNPDEDIGDNSRG